MQFEGGKGRTARSPRVLRTMVVTLEPPFRMSLYTGCRVSSKVSEGQTHHRRGQSWGLTSSPPAVRGTKYGGAVSLAGGTNESSSCAAFADGAGGGVE